MKNTKISIGEGGNAVYSLGVIGAAIYYIGNAVTFWTGVVGFLKALVWPAYMVYELLKFLTSQSLYR
jgi:hypothetical protein